jgi:hypothetical protein
MTIIFKNYSSSLVSRREIDIVIYYTMNHDGCDILLYE